MDVVSLAAFVNSNPRPTCLIDLCIGKKCDAPCIAYTNTALRSQESLLDDILDHSPGANLPTWVHARNINTHISTRSGRVLYTYLIEDHWRVIQWLDSDRKTAGDPSLENALADRNDVAARLQCLLKMMEMVDVGIWEYDQKGKLVYAHEAFLQPQWTSAGQQERVVDLGGRHIPRRS